MTEFVITGSTPIQFVALPIAAAGQNPATLSNGLNSNIATGGQPTVRLAGPTGAFSVGGFQLPAAATPAAGQQLVVTYAGVQPLTIVNEDASSAAVARISTLTSTGVQVPLGAAMTFCFDPTILSGRWVLVSVTPPPPTIIYKPTATTSGNVYGTDVEAYAAIQSLRVATVAGWILLRVDDSLVNPAAATWNTAGTYNFDGVEITGIARQNSNSGGSELVFGPGVVLQGATSTSNMMMRLSGNIEVSNNAHTPLITAASASQQIVINMTENANLQSDQTDGPFIAASGGAYAFIFMIGGSTLGDGVSATLDCTGGGVGLVQAYGHSFCGGLATKYTSVFYDSMVPGTQGVGSSVTCVGTNALPPMVKPSDQSVTSSTGLVNEVGMGPVPMGAVDTWVVRWRIWAHFVAGGGIQLAVTVPTGASLLFSGLGVGAVTANVGSFIATSSGGASNILNSGAETDGVIDLEATVVGDGTHAGAIQLQFTQTGSSGTATMIRKGSSMTAVRQNTI